MVASLMLQMVFFIEVLMEVKGVLILLPTNHFHCILMTQKMRPKFSSFWLTIEMLNTA